MISIESGRHALAKGASFGAMLLTAACASQPSIGPNTVTGLPSHVDGGAGQVMRSCEKLHDRGELATAAALCERAHRLDPTAAEPLLELASILGEIGETELSMQAYRTVLKTSPDNAQAHYGLGRVYLDQGQHDLALAAFEAALRGNPKDLRLYRAVGVANGLLGVHAEAQRVFREGLLVAPEDVALRNNLGLSLVQSGNYDEGVALLDALAKVPGAEQISQENLAMAQGLAAAAHAETMLAEAQAKAEAEALAAAEAEAAAMAMAEAGPPAATDAMAAPRQAAAPAMPVNYPQSSWPMDGPGEAGAAPTSALANKAIASPRQQAAMAHHAPPKPVEPRHIAAPTPLTQAMMAAPNRPAAVRPAEPPAASPAEVNRAPRSLGRPQDRQTARADVGGASDVGEVPSNPGDEPISWGVPREEVTPSPARLVKVGPRDTAPAMPQDLARSAAVPTGQGYAVQFASYTSEERAWRGWNSLQGTAGALLTEIEPNVQHADLGAGTGIVYRLRTGPAAKASAESLCRALKAQGIDCLVVKSEPRMAEGDATPNPATL